MVEATVFLFYYFQTPNYTKHVMKFLYTVIKIH